MSVENQIEDPNFSLIIKKSTSLGYNLQQYKTSFLKRRIDARLRTIGIPTYSKYVQLLDSDKSECQSLFGSLSINVTEFFRNPPVFSEFTSLIIPKLLEGKPTMPHLRIWSAGSATGEEAYSIAILLYENFYKKNMCDFKIYGTDMSSKAVDIAKSGIYGLNSLKNVPPETLEKYFKRHGDDEFELSPEIKNFVKFSVGKIETFPILSLDVIFCRNVLIYVEKQAQHAIFQRFHSLLKPHGYMVLGMDESLRHEQRMLFENASIRHRFYKKISEIA